VRLGALRGGVLAVKAGAILLFALAGIACAAAVACADVDVDGDPAADLVPPKCPTEEDDDCACKPASLALEVGQPDGGVLDEPRSQRAGGR